jgi:hypothetical protein
MKTKLTPELLKQLYITNQKTAMQIAQETSYCKATILYHLRKFNIPTRKEWWLKGRQKITETLIQEEYVLKRKTIEQIAKQTGYKRRKIMRAMQRFGIKTRMKQRREEFDRHYGSIDVGNMTWDYIAGFTDAEGTIYRWHCLYRVSIVNTNKQVLEKIRAFVGYGTLTCRTWLSHHGTTQPELRKQPIFTLCLNRKEIAKKLSGHIVLKRTRLEEKFAVKLAEPQISWAYIAGLFDGDGSISFQEKFGRYGIGIVSKDFGFLSLIRGFLGYGAIYGRKKQVIFALDIGRHGDQRNFCTNILPYLSIQKSKVEKAKTFIENKKWRQG